VDDRREKVRKATRQARDANRRHTAKSLVDRLKKEQDRAWENLKEKQDWNYPDVADKFRLCHRNLLHCSLLILSRAEVA
jgi:hypothetical protein